MKRLSTDAEYLNSGKIVLDADGIPFEPAPKDYVDQRVPIDSFTGTGSPEGRVAAPVGSIYTDTAATNGAIRWIKTSGTGNTGWRVEYGDTGWRNVSSEIIAPWSGNVYMKRNFNTVEIRFEGVFRGENAYDVMNIASGFRPAILRGQGPRIVLHQPDSVANQTRFRIQGDKVLAVSSGNTGPYYGTILYLTDDPWPTMLPGAPF